jgi:hypothetical protein
MSLTKKLIQEINRANAQKSTGPRTPRGRQRSCMNAMKHNLSGQHLILQETEVAAYDRMGTAMFVDLKPKSEPEFQIAQKIIDINFRLNRMAAVENNLFEFGLTYAETNCDHDDRIEVMAAQTRAWKEHASLFDTLGRYEHRLQRQLLAYQKEFERLQAVRKEQERIDKHRSHNEIKRDAFDPASFCKLSPQVQASVGSFHLLNYLPPPKGVETGSAGDLVAGSSADAVQNPPTNMAA